MRKPEKIVKIGSSILVAGFFLALMVLNVNIALNGLNLNIGVTEVLAQSGCGPDENQVTCYSTYMPCDMDDPNNCWVGWRCGTVQAKMFIDPGMCCVEGPEH